MGHDGGGGSFLRSNNPDVLVAGFGQGSAQVEVLNVNCEPFLVVRNC